MNQRSAEMINRLCNAGIYWNDAIRLRRIAMILHRWSEMECGDSNNYASWAIERDEETEKPFMVTLPHSSNKRLRHPIPDREKGALKRLGAIMKRYPHLESYIQGDPRGAPLYILRKGDVPEGQAAESYYNRGLAVYR